MDHRSLPSSADPSHQQSKPLAAWAGNNSPLKGWGGGGFKGRVVSFLLFEREVGRIEGGEKVQKSSGS